jgi:hypothetical protein
MTPRKLQLPRLCSLCLPRCPPRRRRPRPRRRSVRRGRRSSIIAAPALDRALQQALPSSKKLNASTHIRPGRAAC